MSQLLIAVRRAGILALVPLLLIAVACSKKEASSLGSQPSTRAQEEGRDVGTVAPEDDATATNDEEKPGSLSLPLTFARHTGDLDEMMKVRNIRALVTINPISFFYIQGKPAGIGYEAMQEFERFINKKYNTGKLKVRVTFIPTRPDKMESALTEGVGDVIAQAVMITPAREQRVAFTIPLQRDVTHIVVTGQDVPVGAGFDDLAGKPIYVNPVTVAYDDLKRISDERQRAGKPPLLIKAADKALMFDDLVEMVNAGLIPATVTTKQRSDLWSQVLPNVKAHPDMVVSSGVNTGWVIRKNNPELKKVLDEFIQANGIGTSFGNTLLRRYLQNAKWLKSSTNAEEMRKFAAYVEYFKKYSDQYNFDYLMIAAQGYQESLLDQSKRNPTGAIGIMQVIPKYAAAPPINVKDVTTPEKNIEAGVKMLRNITDTYFNDPAISQVNKTLFTFASYNAGPNRIARLRKKAAEDGLDPNKWFSNVELEVAQDIGQETVTYVGNVYKYYIAYKLALEQRMQKDKAKSAVTGM
jgi:membrane-bound lytic murein transglycosylase MltF